MRWRFFLKFYLNAKKRNVEDDSCAKDKRLLWLAFPWLLWKLLGMTVQVKAVQQYDTVVLFITIYKVVISFDSMVKFVASQMKASQI